MGRKTIDKQTQCDLFFLIELSKITHFDTLGICDDRAVVVEATQRVTKRVTNDFKKRVNKNDFAFFNLSRLEKSLDHNLE